MFNYYRQHEENMVHDICNENCKGKVLCRTWFYQFCFSRLILFWLIAPFPYARGASGGEGGCRGVVLVVVVVLVLVMLVLIHNDCVVCMAIFPLLTKTTTATTINISTPTTPLPSTTRQ